MEENELHVPTHLGHRSGAPGLFVKRRRRRSCDSAGGEALRYDSKPNEIELLGNYGALLSLVEVGLGSLLHSFKIPFAGLFLSLNQGYLLCRVSILSQNKKLPYGVSNIAAVLKSLSPAGNKLGPMMSLSMQGLLFSLGLIFGINPIGLSVGMVLLSFWSFLQPLITYYLFFGRELLDAADFLYQKTLPYHGVQANQLGLMLAALVATKALVAVGIAIVAWKKKGVDENQNKLTQFIKTKKSENKHPALMALKDLMSPLFLFSLAATTVFLVFSQHRFAEIIWYLMRPIAVGFIFFYFSRTLTLDRFLSRLHGGRFDAFAKGCEVALTQIRKVI